VHNTFGVQFRNDDIPTVALYHTEARARLETRVDSQALVTSAGVYAQNEVEWSPWFRTLFGVRGDGSRYRVDAIDRINSGTAAAEMLSPKGGATFGPWRATELYVNAGTGLHSNSALGTTMTRDFRGDPVDRVTPLVRAKGAEAGVRTVAVPHLQSTVSVWMLRLDSELVYNGDAGATEPGPPSARHGIEIANYYSPASWLVFDTDASFSRATFSGSEFGGLSVPEAVGTVLSAGASVDGYKRMYGSMRLRYFGSRALLEDNSVRSKPTSLVNVQVGYQLTSHLRVTGDLFNLLDARNADITYYFASRLLGEPLEGVQDFHFHPVVPRTLRVGLRVGF
jgi:outer membrane receptor protein involved in Fe transport